MKTSPAALLATLTLSLALGACDSGDKMDSGSAAPKLPPKAPKEAAAAPAASEPSASAEAPPPKPSGALAPFETGSAMMSDLDKINGAIKMYNLAKSAEMMVKMAPATGGDLNAQKQKYLANASKNKSAGTSAGLTSLNDLVKAGVLKSIPEAPAGKKYVFDANTQEVRLDNLGNK